MSTVTRESNFSFCPIKRFSSDSSSRSIGGCKYCSSKKASSTWFSRASTGKSKLRGFRTLDIHASQFSEALDLAKLLGRFRPAHLTLKSVYSRKCTDFRLPICSHSCGNSTRVFVRLCSVSDTTCCCIRGRKGYRQISDHQREFRRMEVHRQSS